MNNTELHFSKIETLGFKIVPAHIQTTHVLTFQDRIGALKVRLGFGRNKYSIAPGLYSIGKPDDQSPVLVTSNYKLTFDNVRKALEGFNGWILVLDTKGVNVWCAAGKGTFGTDELVKRIEAVNLKDAVSHRRIIVPQLGAPGIAAHEVTSRTGFKVYYGPIRAEDIKAYIAADYKASVKMRTVTFTLRERAVLTPVEFIPALKKSILALGVLFILNGIGIGNFLPMDMWAILGAVFAGSVMVPILLPWIPGKAFAFKGWLLGLIWALFMVWQYDLMNSAWFKTLSYLTILPAISSYLGMNFTGASTYTSFSGVKKEMKVALPWLIGSVGVGIISVFFDMALHLLNR